MQQGRKIFIMAKIHEATDYIRCILGGDGCWNEIFFHGIALIIVLLSFVTV